MHGFDVGEQLVHLLLAIAGGLAQDHVAEVGEGAFVGEREAVGALDERAEVFRQHGLGIGDGFVVHAAQAHRTRSRGVHQLKRAVRAQVAAQLAAFLLVVHGVDEAGAARLVEGVVDTGQVDGHRRLVCGVEHESLYSFSRL